MTTSSPYSNIAPKSEHWFLLQVRTCSWLKQKEAMQTKQEDKEVEVGKSRGRKGGRDSSKAEVGKRTLAIG